MGLISEEDLIKLFYPYSSSDDQMTIGFQRVRVNDKKLPKTKDLSLLE